MKHRLQISMLLAAIILMPACAFKTYKPEIQQGNNLDRYYVNQLKLGMTKETVIALLGSPIMVDIFHNNKWEYVNYSSNTQYRLRLTFDGNKLINIDGVKLDELSPLSLEQQALEKERIAAELELFIKQPINIPDVKINSETKKTSDSARSLAATPTKSQTKNPNLKSNTDNSIIITN